MPLHATGPQDSVDTGFGAAPELGVAVSSLVAPGSGGESRVPGASHPSP